MVRRVREGVESDASGQFSCPALGAIIEPRLDLCGKADMQMSQSDADRMLVDPDDEDAEEDTNVVVDVQDEDAAEDKDVEIEEDELPDVRAVSYACHLTLRQTLCAVSG